MLSRTQNRWGSVIRPLWWRRSRTAALCVLLGSLATVLIAWWLASRVLILGHVDSAELTLIQPNMISWYAAEFRLPGKHLRQVVADPTANDDGVRETPLQHRKTSAYIARLRHTFIPESQGSNSTVRIRLTDALAAMPEVVDVRTRDRFRATPIGRMMVDGWGHLPAPSAQVDTTSVCSIASGWPVLSCWGWQSCTYRWSRSRSTLMPVPLESVGLALPPPPTLAPPDIRTIQLRPYLPVWPGFAVDSLFYGAAVWMMLGLPGEIRRCWRRRNGRCPDCGYSLLGLPGDSLGKLTCPECGATCAHAGLKS